MNGGSLLTSVKDYLTPDIMQKISSVVGESPANTRNVMEGIVPTLLSKMADLAGSSDGASQLMNMINQQGSDGNILNNLSGKLSGGAATESLMNSGRDIVKGLFGGKLNSVIDIIAGSVGIKNNSIASLLSIAAPLVLGVLGKEKSARGLSTAGLAGLLTGQKGIFSQLLPAGLGALIGSGGVERPDERIAEPVRPYDTPRYETSRAAYEPRRETSSAWWLWPVLGLGALGLLLYSFWGRGPEVPQNTIVRQETRPELPVRQERTPALQDPQPIQKETKPLPQEPRAATQEAIVSQSERAGSGTDTPISRSAVSGDPGEAGQVDVRQAQETLKNQGQDPGPIDGIIGPRTRQALREFQKANGLEQTGTLDTATKQKLAFAR